MYVIALYKYGKSVLKLKTPISIFVCNNIKCVNLRISVYHPLKSKVAVSFCCYSAAELRRIVWHLQNLPNCVKYLQLCSFVNVSFMFFNEYSNIYSRSKLINYSNIWSEIQIFLQKQQLFQAENDTTHACSNSCRPGTWKLALFSLIHSHNTAWPAAAATGIGNIVLWFEEQLYEYILQYVNSPST